MSNPLQKHHKAINQLAKDYGVSYLAMFGSTARQESTPTSDIDLLVDFNHPNTSLFDLLSLEQQLSQVYNTQVDLVTKKGLSPYIKPYIQSNLTTIYKH